MIEKNISTVNLLYFELRMDQGILFEITRGFAKTNLIKNRPKKFTKFSFSVLYTFSEIVYALHPTLQRLLLWEFLFTVAILSQSNKRSCINYQEFRFQI